MDKLYVQQAQNNYLCQYFNDLCATMHLVMSQFNNGSQWTVTHNYPVFVPFVHWGWLWLSMNPDSSYGAAKMHQWAIALFLMQSGLVLVECSWTKTRTRTKTKTKKKTKTKCNTIWVGFDGMQLDLCHLPLFRTTSSQWPSWNLKNLFFSLDLLMLKLK